MSQEIEIEFKSMLLEEEYLALKEAYSFQPSILQTNYYFDTPNFDLKHQHMGLRVRTFETSGEITLKTPAEQGLLETTDTLDGQAFQDFLKTMRFPTAPNVYSMLEKQHIDTSLIISPFASLTTERMEAEFGNGILLCLDCSHYYGKTDYELEIEVPHHKEGKQFFNTFLAKHHLPYRPAQNKIQRAKEAKLMQ